MQREGRTDTIKFIVEDESYFVLVEPDLQFHCSKVVVIAHLRYVEAKPDQGNRKTLVVTVRRERGKLTLVLIFDDSDNCLRTVRSIAQRRQQIEELDLALAQSYFGSIELALEV
jgi:hypothetical protein